MQDITIQENFKSCNMVKISLFNNLQMHDLKIT